MARIETYPLDYNISVNDYVIGTDGDSLNATKNYKVMTFLDYLGTMYNLNSTDLLFNYNNVAAGSVADGQVSTNNFADVTILMSGVTNIYVSKLTAFGQLVDDIIDTIGTEGLSIMFTDMGNRNNLGIFTVVSTADVDVNTINMTVTASTAVGSISAGKVMGIRIGVGGGGAGDNLGDHIATQSLDMAQNDIINIAAIDGERINLETAFGFWGMGITVAGKLGFGLPVGALPAGFASLYTMDGSGSPVNSTDIITLGDLSNYVTVDTTQSITGNKTFTSPTTVESLVFTQNGDSFLVPFGVQHNNTLGFTFQDNTLGGGQCFSFLGQGLTANRVQTIQDKDGTIAHLDDIPVSGEYEESTWVITATDSGGGATYSGTFHANFVRVGKLVTYVINLSSLNTTGVPSGVFTLSLPYSVAGNASAAASVARVFASNKNFYSIMGIANASTSTLTFDIQAGLDSYTEPFDAVTWTGGRIYVSGSYIATGV